MPGGALISTISFTITFPLLANSIIRKTGMMLSCSMVCWPTEHRIPKKYFSDKRWSRWCRLWPRFLSSIPQNYVREFCERCFLYKAAKCEPSYALPKTWLQKTPFQSVSVSATVNNIILWTPWITFDPESFSSGAGTE